ncbi:alpha/beta hydrolase [uncultured Stenotrophomonas sp.]|uniref:serine aminopeptidase domain-containing protein n=1 Tax=uncultured Stenotrophomonas sp. TaxID=165438 RepID=UPI0025D34811|nr:alpha/beta hydrolase [uncultured Stenotrophomonas sp.]
MAGTADLGIVDADDYGLNETGWVTALVILPGLDGTAALHAQFVACLGDVFGSVTVLRYPPDKALDYAALEVLVRAGLPRDVPFVLLGESFSGPIALSIAADPPANLVGVVLSTTFARTPLPFFSPLAPLTRFAPVRALPLALLSWWLLGRWATPALNDALERALLEVHPAVLRQRAALAMQADVSALLTRVTLPVLYLRAEGDRLIMPGAGELILSTIKHAAVRSIAGPHLLLQACPSLAARAVRDFVEGLQSARLR